MSKPDVDEVLNYLSSKFKKIFCDREFVSSVIADFQIVLGNKDQARVLVFPALGPIYLKALRYQAKVFDLAVFNIGTLSGKFKSLAVCHKSHLKAMSKRKRPERQLYVPPAQRMSRKSEKKVTSVVGLCDVNLCCVLAQGCEVGTSNQHQDCQFRRFLLFKQFDTSAFDRFIKIYDSFATKISWKLSNLRITPTSDAREYKTYPIYDFDVDVKTEGPLAVLVSDEKYEFDHTPDNNLYKLECNLSEDLQNCNILDLKPEHFFLISIEGSDYFHECQEQHDAIVCCQNVKRKLHLERYAERSNEQDRVKNHINKNKKASDKHEEEKEIMRITKEGINRKTRPIMKYVDDDDTLRIDKNDSVNNWEDLFDDSGQIQEDFLTEIVDNVGGAITLVKANEDYTQYSNKPSEDLEHIVELYNFPASLETHDLVQAFSDINSDAMYIKWVDDTHALLVLGSLSQAQKAINMGNSLIKVRPMTAASAISKDVANKSDLKPAMKRPATNLQTARRLITTHLGTKSKLSKEQMAKEKQDLKNAKEKKRLLKKNEQDAWEGNLRSSVVP